MTDNGRWTVDSMPDVSDKVAIVTGELTGVSYQWPVNEA
jgi:hypothetical protein